MPPLMLERAPIGSNLEDHGAFRDGIIGGCTFLSPGAPQARPWMWASGHSGDIRGAALGYERTREAARAAFANSWRRE